MSCAFFVIAVAAIIRSAGSLFISEPNPTDNSAITGGASVAKGLPF